MAPVDPKDPAIARKNHLTLAVLLAIVLGMASTAHFAREALFPVFFKL